MKYSDLIPGILVKVPDGLGIVVKTGVRESMEDGEGATYEKVVLVLINEDPKWYKVENVLILD
jgi:hypothetical protein